MLKLHDSCIFFLVCRHFNSLKSYILIHQKFTICCSWGLLPRRPGLAWGHVTGTWTTRRPTLPAAERYLNMLSATLGLGLCVDVKLEAIVSLFPKCYSSWVWKKRKIVFCGSYDHKELLILQIGKKQEKFVFLIALIFRQCSFLHFLSCRGGHSS